MFVFDVGGSGSLLSRCLVRLFWLGEIKEKRPDLCPCFFEVDLAPFLLKFLRRDNGGCCGELMNGPDCILCTVLWLTSTLPLLLAVEGISFVVHSKRQVANHANTSKVVAQFMFGVAMAVFLFCLHGLRVSWPKHFQGPLTQHDINYRTNGWMLIERQSMGAVLSSSLTRCR